MNYDIDSIIKELISLDESFAKDTDSLRKLLKELFEARPHIIPDKTFVEQLRARLIAKPALFRSWFSLTSLAIPVMAVAIMVLVVSMKNFRPDDQPTGPLAVVPEEAPAVKMVAVQKPQTLVPKAFGPIAATPKNAKLSAPAPVAAPAPMSLSALPPEAGTSTARLLSIASVEPTASSSETISTATTTSEMATSTENIATTTSVATSTSEIYYSGSDSVVLDSKGLVYHVSAPVSVEDDVPVYTSDGVFISDEASSTVVGTADQSEYPLENDWAVIKKVALEKAKIICDAAFCSSAQVMNVRKVLVSTPAENGYLLSPAYAFDVILNNSNPQVVIVPLVK